MKKFIYLSSLFFLIYFSTNGQNCNPKTIYYQKQIDSFNINYPGCKTILSDLYIQGSDIINLNGLLGLKEIKGNLIIQGVTNLEYLSGLDSLVNIGDGKYNTYYQSGDGINISYNDKLKSLKGLDNLKTKAFYLSISENKSLEDLNGFPDIAEFQGQLILGNNPKLTDLSSLKVLNYVGYLQIDDASIVNLSGFDSLKTIYRLKITNCQNLVNLSGFNNLDSVTYSTDISNNPNLIDLNGLNNLSMAYLTIENNPLIHDLTGLDNLNTGGLTLIDNVGLISLKGLNKKESSLWGIEINNSDLLTDLTGLENLKNLGRLTIMNNDSIQDLHGLENLASLDDLDVENNQSLKNLNGINNLTKLSYAAIGNNNNLTTLDGMENISKVDFMLAIYSNKKLKDLNALSTLDTVDGNGFSIGYNDALSSFIGLENLNYVSNFYIDNNNSLYNLEGIQNLKNINGNLIIQGNPILVDFSGFKSLNNIHGIVNIINNKSLLNFNGLNNIKSVSELNIDNNPSLTAMTGFDNLVTVGSKFILSNNSSLINLSGLTQLDTVKWDFTIQNNGLVNLKGINKLRYIGNYFNLLNNNSIVNLEGASNLKYIKYLFFNMNKSLTSLEGLADSIMFLKVEIYNNQSLSDCAIKLFCDYYFKFNPQIIHFKNNATDCNTRQEVQDKCNAVSTSEYISDASFNIYPNPGNGVYNISMPEICTGKLSITNNLGTVIKYYYTDNSIDISNQAAGIYYLKITTKDKSIIKELLKN